LHHFAKIIINKIIININFMIGIVTFLYILSALALVGMKSFEVEGSNGNFGAAFNSRGWTWASQIVAIVIKTIIIYFISFFLIFNKQCSFICEGRINYFAVGRVGILSCPTSTAVCNGGRRTSSKNIWRS
jgi:hypothetical protein